MEETIKSKEVIAYKGMKSDMTCKGFHYEVGKSYKTDKVELCEWGFHACLNPIDVLDYYSQSIKSRYFKVKLSGEITKCDFEDTKVAATEITILEEITDTFNEAIKNTEWWKNENVLDLLYWSDGFARVQRSDRQYNYIDKQGKLLSEQWFEWVGIFYKGFARVRISDKQYNFINKNGKFLSAEWFEWIGNFYDGFARVQRSDRQYNYIDKQGKLLSEQWFEWVGIFYKGFARVRISDKQYNFINKDGKIISDEWFIDACYLDDGFTVVKKANGEWCNIDKTGKLIKLQ